MWNCVIIGRGEVWSAAGRSFEKRLHSVIKYLLYHISSWIMSDMYLLTTISSLWGLLAEVGRGVDLSDSGSCPITCIDSSGIAHPGVSVGMFACTKLLCFPKRIAYAASGPYKRRHLCRSCVVSYYRCVGIVHGKSGNADLSSYRSSWKFARSY